jgi:hypothetical protein
MPGRLARPVQSSHAAKHEHVCTFQTVPPSAASRRLALEAHNENVPGPRWTPGLAQRFTQPTAISGSTPLALRGSRRERFPGMGWTPGPAQRFPHARRYTLRRSTCPLRLASRMIPGAGVDPRASAAFPACRRHKRQPTFPARMSPVDRGCLRLGASDPCKPIRHPIPSLLSQATQLAVTSIRREIGAAALVLLRAMALATHRDAQRASSPRPSTAAAAWSRVTES